MTTERKVIRAKVGLLELAKQLGNVSRACKMMGYSRDSFYRFKDRRATTGKGKTHGGMTTHDNHIGSHSQHRLSDQVSANTGQQPICGSLYVSAAPFSRRWRRPPQRL